MGATSIAWSQRVWNVVTGCSKVSPGCDHCFAERMAKRLHGRVGYPDKDPFAVTLHLDRLEEPLRVAKPSLFFVCSMGDLFHPSVPFAFVKDVFALMRSQSRHTFQVLTKRPGRMAYFAEHIWRDAWPANVWAGTSVESAKYLPRLDVLARVPAKVRFVSAEPLLSVLDLRPWLECPDCHSSGCRATDRRGSVLSWVIVGGESGPGARPFDIVYARDIIDQCQDAGVPCFLKQLGAHPQVNDAGEPEFTEWALKDVRDAYDDGDKVRIERRLKDRKGADPNEWPEDLRVQQMPVRP